MENDSERPEAVKWFRVYSVFMAVMYWLFMAGGIAMVFLKPGIEGTEYGNVLIFAAMFMILGFAIAFPYTAALFLKPKPWVWILDMVLICIGLAGCLTLPFCIALLIYWLKPELKAYFGRS